MAGGMVYNAAHNMFARGVPHQGLQHDAALEVHTGIPAEQRPLAALGAHLQRTAGERDLGGGLGAFHPDVDHDGGDA